MSKRTSATKTTCLQMIDLLYLMNGSLFMLASFSSLTGSVIAES